MASSPASRPKATAAASFFPGAICSYSGSVGRRLPFRPHGRYHFFNEARKQALAEISVEARDHEHRRTKYHHPRSNDTGSNSANENRQYHQPCGCCDNCVQTVNGDLTDTTPAAQQFLSCVKLTGQNFGLAHIIAVLRGSRAERVLGRRHDRLDVFGTGKEHSTEQWRVLAQQFIRLALLEQDFNFGSLRLAPKGWDVLHGKEKVLVPRERAPRTAERAVASERRTRRTIIRPVTRRRFQEIGQFFAAGQSLEQIAQRYNILPETVIQNLCRFHESSGSLDPERLLAASRLPAPERARVLRAFERLGHQRLAPVYEALAGAVPYEELHLLRLYLLLSFQQHD